jgi:putative DNA primase/helicase
LIVAAETRDDAQSEWGRLLVWQDNDGHTHTWAAPVEMLAASDSVDFRRQLMRNGLTVATNGKARQRLVDYVLTFKPQSSERVRCVTKTGWHGGRYVLPSQVFGKTEGEGVIFQGSTVSDFATSGTLADWQREIAGRAVGNSRIIFAIACSFAGVLTEMANESGGGFQFTGTTSKGKTSTLVDPAASVWGHPERFAKKWRATTNGMEGLSLARNHSTLILDDISQSNAKEAGEAVYMVANGQGKARMQKEGGNRPLSTWRTFILSSGEVDLAQHMAEAGGVAKGGQVARMPSIPADAGAGHYVVENLHGLPDGRQFADTMKAVTRQFYGTAGTAFVEALTDPATLKETRETIRDSITDIVKLMRIQEGAAPEVGRIAARFALVAFAGELATDMGVTGWNGGDAFKAAVRCFNDWLAESGGAMGADDKALFAQVSAILQAHGSSRFPPHDISEEDLQRVLNRAGFSFNDDENIFYWAESGSFSKELCKGFNPTSAAKALVKSGRMEPGTSRPYTQQRKVPSLGKNGRWYYIFTPSAVGAE